MLQEEKDELSRSCQSHCKKFWSELDKYVGNAKQLDKTLNKHKLGLCGINGLKANN